MPRLFKDDMLYSINILSGFPGNRAHMGNCIFRNFKTIVLEIFLSWKPSLAISMAIIKCLFSYTGLETGRSWLPGNETDPAQFGNQCLELRGKSPLDCEGHGASWYRHDHQGVWQVHWKFQWHPGRKQSERFLQRKHQEGWVKQGKSKLWQNYGKNPPKYEKGLAWRS